MCFSSTQQQNQKWEPADHIRPYYESMTPEIMSLASKPYEQYQGMTVAPMNAMQETAGQLIMDRGMYGNPQTNSARGGLLNITEGNAMNPYGGASNPAFEQALSYTRNNMTDAFNRGTRATTDAMAARAGGYGGSGHLDASARNAQALGDAVGGMEANMRNQQLNRAAGIYQNDIGNVMQAAGMAPTFDMLDSQSFEQMMGWGNQLQGQLGKELDASKAEFDAQQNYPMNMADWTISAMQRLGNGYGEGWNKGKSTPSIFSMLFGGR